MQVDLVLDLLLVDEANPRSIAFQLARLREHIDELPGSKTSIRRPAEERLALSLLNTVQLIDVRELARPGGRAAAEAREGLLGKLIADLSLLSETLTRAYFSHAAAIAPAVEFCNMKLLATHITRYWYSGPVSMCHTEVHLAPRPRENQTILEYELDVSPTPDSMVSREDYFGNQVTFFSIAEPHRELIITSRCLAESGSLRAAGARPFAALGAGARGSGETRHARDFRGRAVCFRIALHPALGRRSPQYAASFLRRRPSITERRRRSVAPHLHRVPLRSARHHHRDSGG